MITIEQLNAIPGRPDWATWIVLDPLSIFLRDEYSHPIAGIQLPSCSFSLFCCKLFNDGKELLAFANYVRRVELDVASYSQDPHYLGRDEAVVREHLEDAIQDAYESLAEPSCGELHEIEIDEVVPDKVSWCIDFEKLISPMHEWYYRECDDWASDESIEPLPGAEEALAVWADTYLRPTAATFARNGKVETRHIAICDSTQEFIIVEDEVARR